MRVRHAGWDNRSAEQWLDQAGRFEEMAKRFDRYPRLNSSFSVLAQDARKRAWEGSTASLDCGGQIRQRAGTRVTDADVQYFWSRAAHEKAAAEGAGDIRVRRVHLEMAKRYEILIRAADVGSSVGPRRES